jgi:hypothetical protein
MTKNSYVIKLPKSIKKVKTTTTTIKAVKAVKVAKLRKETIKVKFLIETVHGPPGCEGSYQIWNQPTPKSKLNIGDWVVLPDGEGKICGFEYSPSIDREIVSIHTRKDGFRIYLPEACLLKHEYQEKTIVKNKRVRSKKNLIKKVKKNA